MTAAGPLAPEKRAVLLERLVTQLKLQGVRHPTDADIERTLGRCLRGLMQAPAA